jgi:RHS repeat-associated protein
LDLGCAAQGAARHRLHFNTHEYASPATPEQFTWDVAGGRPLLLQDRFASYVYGPDGQILEQVQGSTATYYHTDHLGSVRALTDQSKAVVATYSYDAYGQPTASTGSVANPFRYAGQYRDAESGLYYLRARYYAPATQQFLRRDPLVAATEQAYAYAGGSPLNGGDPGGLQSSGRSGTYSEYLQLIYQNMMNTISWEGPGI